MTIRFQRLLILLISLILATGAVLLILFNYKNNIIFFYTPTELINTNTQINKNIRIGGFVKEKSLQKITTSINGVNFIITDNKNNIFVEYEGNLPDLFRENQGVVVEGTLVKKNKLIASRVFAKHDENYMPASIKKQLEQTKYWKKNYSTTTLLNNNIPEFSSKSLTDENLILTNHDIKNKITLINFFASWCIPCQSEHSLIMELKDRFPELIMIGFNYKDKKEDAIIYLSKNRNPYTFVVIDDGKIGLEFGVFGLPETFLTNEKGQIIFQHTGPLTKEIIQKNIIPNFKF